MNRFQIYSPSKNFKSWLVWSVFLYSCLVFNFLEPFNIEITHFIPVYHLLLCIHGVIAAFVVFYSEKLIQPKLQKQLNDWNAFHSSFWYLFLILAVAIANWFYVLAIHYTISGWHGIQVPNRSFTHIIFIFGSIYLVWAMICAASGFFFQPKHAKDKDSKITLLSENQSDNIKIDPNNIICFKTCDNYLQLYYLNHEGEVKERMIRSSMKRMMVQLDSNLFYRCHQSFLVNKKHILGLNKVKNQTMLELSHLTFNVSVSRNNIKHVKTLLAS